MGWIKNNKYLMGALMVLFLGGLTFITFGFIPALTVDGWSISYAKLLKVYGALRTFDDISMKNRTDQRELKKMALEDIVENIFVDILIEETGRGIIRRAEELVQKALSDDKNMSLEEAARRLYGLSAMDFKDLVLLPQAKKDALFEHYQSDPKRLEELWTALTRTAKVKIYYPGFYWQEGEIKIK